jgi:YbbR domain-containing protein
MSKIRKLMNSQVFWLVLSFLISFSLWFYVNGVYNPQDTKDFSNIPVTVAFDGSIPQQNNLAILKSEDLTVDIKLEGSRVALANLSKDEIAARVDLSSVTVAGDYELPITVTLPGTSLLISSQSVSSIKMSFDKLDRKQVDAKIVTDGQVKDGYWLGEITASPGTMKVEGPASLLAKVENYLIEVDVTGLNAVKTMRQNVVYIDADGEVVDGKYLSGEFSSVSVNIPVYYIKEVPLVVTGLNKSGGSDATMFHYEVSPSSVRIAGPESEMELLNQIVVDTVDTSKIEYRDSYSKELTVPTGIKLLDDVESVDVVVTIEDGTTRRLTINEFSLENVDEGVNARVQEASLTVRLRGLSADVMSISANDIRAVVDLSSFTATLGNVSVPVTFTMADGKNVGVVGKYTVTVTIQ